VNVLVTERFVFERLRFEHVEGVADLHLRALPDYFLSQLGVHVLQSFYREFCLHPFDFGVVARLRETHALAALVVGTNDVQAHFRSFYRRHALSVAYHLLRGMIRNPKIRKGVTARLPQLRLALGSMPPFRWKIGGRQMAGDAEMDCRLRLLSIAVDPGFRGTGLALEIQRRFLDQLKEAGHPRVGLSVKADNERAIAFYRKTGWTLTRESARGLWFERSL
jgi:ribosomal protein S18 acetylase RimI-like enzyme